MSHYDTLKAQIASDFGTPAAVIDLDIVDANITSLQARCDAAGIANRPHIKTHKSPVLACQQIAAGAKGITCQKLGEAEIMAEAGIDDIIIATNLLGAARSGRLAALQRQLSLKCCADNQVTLSAYAEAAQQAERPLEVLIECDTGQKRAGVETVEEMLMLAGQIQDNPWLVFAGLLFYPPLDGWPATQTFYHYGAEGLAEMGLKAGIVSTGGTPNLRHLGMLDGATEHRSGTSIFNDRMMLADGIASPDDCAFHIYTSIVSKATPLRGILDAGSKAFTSDTGGLSGFGQIEEYQDAKIHKLSEEHGFLDFSECQSTPEIGEIVRVLPNHVCVSVNMFDRLIAVRGGQIAGEIAVAARGRLV